MDGIYPIRSPFCKADIMHSDAAAETADPNQFDPEGNLRGGLPLDYNYLTKTYASLSDYDSVNLPVFTCSSRDYTRIRGMEPELTVLYNILTLNYQSK